MSLATSRELVDTFFHTNGLDPQQFAFDFEKVQEKSTLLCFKGPSNAGKICIANSLYFSYKTSADISQGINNNFWLKGALGKRVISHGEAQLNEENQEDVIKLMEGAEMTVHLKGLGDAYLPCTPTLSPAIHGPGVVFSRKNMLRHFITGHALLVAKWMMGWPNLLRGDLDPRVWLDILEGKKPTRIMPPKETTVILTLILVRSKNWPTLSILQNPNWQRTYLKPKLPRTLCFLTGHP